MVSKIEFVPAVGSTVTLHDATGSYKVSHAEGLAGPPAPRDVSRSAPGRDGSLDDTRYMGERSITLEGEIVGSSQSDVLSKWDTLASAFQSTLLAKGTLKITRPDSSVRQATVIMTGSASPSFEGGASFLQYQINFRAPDPRWYGTTLNTSATSITGNGSSTTTSITNAGNAPSQPKFTFGGTDSVGVIAVNVPSAYTSISPQGSAIELQAGGSGYFNVDSSSYIDCLTKTASLASGSPSMSATTEWPILYPGTSTWVWASASPVGTHTTTISWYDAWW